jgi:hypothetical protein
MKTASWFAGMMAILGVLVSTQVALWADDEEANKKTFVYKGTWVNRKMKSSGPLQCTMEESDDSEWSARFEGKFKNDPFKYDVKFSAKKSSGKTDLKGSAVIDGDPYEWVGSIKGDTLTVRYRSTKGYNGEFRMKKPAEKKAPSKKPKSKSKTDSSEPIT